MFLILCSTSPINHYGKFVCENFATVLSYVSDHEYGEHYDAKNHVVNDDCLIGLCGEKEEDSTPPDLVNGDSTELGCGGTAPVVESISCENSGVQNHPDYGDLPTFTIKSTVSDEDGDLTYYQLFVDIDGTLDGVEDENDTELNPVEGAVNDEECGVFNANLSVTIFLNGSMPEYDTVYEWYVRVSRWLR